MQIKQLLSAIVIALGLMSANASATLIGDTVDVNVDGINFLGTTVTAASGAELLVNSSENIPDEQIAFDFEDFFIDLSFTDGQGASWFWADSGTTFSIIISSLDTGFASGIQGLSVASDSASMISSLSVINGTSISLNIVNSSGITSETARIQLLDTAAPVPEPATLALFGLALAGIGLSRKKKIS